MVCRTINHMILIVLLVCSLSFSAEAFEGWVQEDDQIEIDDEVFTVYSGTENVVVLESNDSETGRVYARFNISKQQNNVYFMYDDVKSNWTDYYEKYNITGIKGVEEELMFHVKVEELEPKITINSELESETVFFREYFNKSITLKNTGTQTAESFFYSETLPLNFRKEDHARFATKQEDDDSYTEFRRSNADTDSNVIYWRGDIDPGEEVKIVARMEIYTKKEHTSLYSFKKGTGYFKFNGEDYKMRDNDPGEITMKTPLVFECFYDKNPQHIGEMNTVTFWINNTHSQNKISVENITIIPSEWMIYDISKSDFEKYYGHVYHGPTSLSPGSGKRKEMIFDFFYAGHYNSSAIIEYEYLDVQFTNRTDCELETEIGTIEAYPVLNESTVYKSSDEKNITVEIKTLGERDDFRNLSVNISSQLFDDRKYVYLNMNRNSLVIEKFLFRAPTTNLNLKKNMTFSYSYESLYGQRFYNLSVFEIEILKRPFNATINISYLFSPVYMNMTVNGTNGSNETTYEMRIVEGAVGFRIELKKIEDIDYDELTVFLENEDFRMDYELTEEEIEEFNENERIDIDFNFTEEELEESDDMMIRLEYEAHEEKIIFGQEINNTYKKTNSTINETLDNSTIANKTTNTTNMTDPTNTTDLSDNSTILAPENSTLKDDITDVKSNKEEEEAIENLFSKKKKGMVETFLSGADNLVIAFVIVGVVLMVIVVIGFKVAKSKKKKKKDEIQKPVEQPEKKGKPIKMHKDGTIVVLEPPEPSYNYDEVVEFIKNARGENITEEEIRNRLLEKGWLPDLLDVIVAQHPPKNPPAGLQTKK